MNWQVVCLMFGLLIVVCQVGLVQSQDGSAPQPGGSTSQSASIAQSGRPRVVSGVLVSKQKYSFSVATKEGVREIRLRPETVISARIVRPRIDFDAGVMQGIIPASASTGRAPDNLVIESKLPKQLFFRYKFADQQSVEDARQSKLLQAKKMTLSKVPLTAALSTNDRPEWTGAITNPRWNKNPEGLEFTASLEGLEVEVTANWKTLLLEGFNLLDFKPLEMDVFVSVSTNAEETVAERVEFAWRKSLSEVFSGDRPKVLVIGDSVSFNYFPQLLAKTRSSVDVYHANANCQGSANHTKLHRWIGIPGDGKYQWDLIVFNFGLADAELKKDAYQENLREALNVLKKSGSKLLWVDSTPVPYGFNDQNLKPGAFIAEAKQFDFEFEELKPVGLKPGRMKLQNSWAMEIFKNDPEVDFCSLWETVKSDRSGKFKRWWYGKDVNFNQMQSTSLSESLSEKILTLLAK